MAQASTVEQFSTQGRPVAVRRVTLTNYRNYASLRFDVPDNARLLAFTGPNGAGKTNLLEAVSYLSAGRGLRAAKLSEVARFGGDGLWAVAAELDVAGGEIAIGTGLSSERSTAGDADFDETDFGRATDRRIVRINGAPVSGPAALTEYMSMMWLTPKMDRLFVEAGSSRRRFLDRMVMALHPDHGRQLGAYERSMRERMRLLTDTSKRADPAWLSALERRMADHGVAVAAARIDTLIQLAAHVDAQPENAFPKADLALTGQLEAGLEKGSALEVEEGFAARLAQLRDQDARMGRASEGPHKTDLLARHREKDMPAPLCSTGEQKALLIGLVLAHARLLRVLTGTAPVMLLDEIAAHLDVARREALFEALDTMGGQAWLTGTDDNLFDGLGASSLKCDVRDGVIHQC